MSWFTNLSLWFRGALTSGKQQAALDQEFSALCAKVDDLLTEGADQLQELKKVKAEAIQLRDTITVLERDKLLLSDRLEDSYRDREELWASFQESLRSERIAYQSHINLQSQSKYGTVLFPDAPHAERTIKPADPGPIGRRGRRLMSEEVSIRGRAFLSDYLNKKTANPRNSTESLSSAAIEIMDDVMNGAD